MLELRRVTPSDIGEFAAQFDERTYFHSPDLEFGHELQLFAPSFLACTRQGRRRFQVSIRLLQFHAFITPRKDRCRSWRYALINFMSITPTG